MPIIETVGDLIEALKKYPVDAVIIKRTRGYHIMRELKAHNNDLVRKGRLIRKYKPDNPKLEGFTHVIGVEII